jgi:hypothetical protein
VKVPATIEQKLHHGLEHRILDLLENEYGMVSGDKIRRMFAKEIATIADECIVDPTRLDAGQAVWWAVEVGEGKNYATNAKHITYVPVILDLMTPEDLDTIAGGLYLRERRKHKAIRLFENAYEQGGTLTHSDVAFWLNVSTGTIGKDVKQYMEETGKIVHTRGIVHDIGPTLTHKKIIVSLFYRGYQEPEIEQRTNHSLDAINRYIKAAQKVELAMEHTDDPARIARMLGMTPRLVKEYIDIIKEVKLNDQQ